MGGLGATRVLRMLEIPPPFGRGEGEALRHVATQGHGECLYATADAKYGNLTVIGQLGDEQFRQVALAIDASKTRLGLLPAV